MLDILIGITQLAALIALLVAAALIVQWLDDPGSPYSERINNLMAALSRDWRH